MAVAGSAVSLGGMADLSRLVADFERFLLREDRSPATVRAYRWGLDDLCGFLEAQGVQDLAALAARRPVLEAWQDSLLQRQLRPRSRSLAATAVRQFFRWAADHDYCEGKLERWLAGVRVKPLRPRPLEPAVLATLRGYFAQRPQTPAARLLHLRNRALFSYLLGTGARVSEALQVSRRGYESATVRQKGGTEKTLTCPPSVIPLIQDYLGERQDACPSLFATAQGRPMSPLQVRQVWLTTTQKLGLARFTTHQLRHTFATELLDNGIDHVVVAELLGHHGLGTILNYVQVREGKRKAALSVIDGMLTLPVEGRVLPRLKRRRGRRPQRLTVLDNLP